MTATVILHEGTYWGSNLEENYLLKTYPYYFPGEHNVHHGLATYRDIHSWFLFQFPWVYLGDNNIWAEGRLQSEKRFTIDSSISSIL